MKVLIAPTAFKGTFSPAQVARAIETGVGRACAWSDEVETILLPLADGGDGTIEAVHLAVGGVVHEQQVLGPTGAPVTACWLDMGTQALVELASACGIATLTSAGLPLAPLQAHTWGLGQMIARCFEAGRATINIAVGGSASTDGGMGALRALGVAFFDDSGNEIEELGAQILPRIRDCDVSGARWLTRGTRLRILTDVDNPLLGQRGAASVFAPQKGADASQVAQLEAGLANYADVLETCAGATFRNVPGAGAAGGTAFGLACALGAELASGFAWLRAITELDEKVRACDLVISGEGCFDNQSLCGKLTGQLSRLAEECGKQFWVVAADTDANCHSQALKVIKVEPSEGQYCTEEDISAAVQKAFSAFHNFFTTGK